MKLELRRRTESDPAIGKLLLTMIGAIGQFEREMMLERQREGIAKAKTEGKYKDTINTVQEAAKNALKDDEKDERHS